jgi:ribosome-binding protein aMBF1 (putative translation factor)
VLLYTAIMVKVYLNKVKYPLALAGTIRYYVIMSIDINSHIRESVRVELARKDMTQTDLAERLGVSRQRVNQFIRGRGGNLHGLWQKIFDELGLELVVREKVK